MGFIKPWAFRNRAIKMLKAVSHTQALFFSWEDGHVYDIEITDYH